MGNDDNYADTLTTGKIIKEQYGRYRKSMRIIDQKASKRGNDSKLNRPN